MQKFSLGFLRAPQGPHWPKTSCYGNGAPLWRGKCEGRKKAVWKPKFFTNCFYQGQLHNQSQRKEGKGGEGGREGGSRVGGWVGWWGEGGVGWGSVPLTCIPSWAEGHLHFFTSRTPPHHSKSLTGFFFWKAFEDSENFLEVPRQPWWGPRYLFEYFGVRPWRHSWVPSESCLEEGTCFFFWLWLLLLASFSDGAFSLWSHTLHRTADKGLSSSAKLVSGLSCKSRKLKPTLSWGWTSHFTLPWTSSLECQWNLKWIPFPFFSCCC